jgi:hypothetical protein
MKALLVVADFRNGVAERSRKITQTRQLWVGYRTSVFCFCSGPGRRLGAECFPGSGSSRCVRRLLPRSRSLPQIAGGSASALSLSRPAQASLALRPAGSLSRLSDLGYEAPAPSVTRPKPLVSFRIDRQLSGWNRLDGSQRCRLGPLPLCRDFDERRGGNLHCWCTRRQGRAIYWRCSNRASKLQQRLLKPPEFPSLAVRLEGATHQLRHGKPIAE